MLSYNLGGALVTWLTFHLLVVERLKMKTMGKFFIGIVVLLLLSIAQADEAIYTIQVDGLSCPFCAYGIEKQLNAIEGVDNVEVNIANGLVNIGMKPDTLLDKERTRQAVSDAGFSLRSFKQSYKKNIDVPEK